MVTASAALGTRAPEAHAALLRSLMMTCTELKPDNSAYDERAGEDQG